MLDIGSKRIVETEIMGICGLGDRLIHLIQKQSQIVLVEGCIFNFSGRELESGHEESKEIGLCVLTLLLTHVLQWSEIFK